MAHRLHIHIVAPSRRVVVGLRVLLMASGLVARITTEDPTRPDERSDSERPDLVILDMGALAHTDAPRTALRRLVPGGLPWCALAHNRGHEDAARMLGATYLLPLGFAPELLFSILAGCLPVAHTPAFSPVHVTSRGLGPLA